MMHIKIIYTAMVSGERKQPMAYDKNTDLLADTIEILKDQVDSNIIRKDIYSNLIAIFENFGVDNLDDCTGLDSCFDDALVEYQDDDMSLDDDDEDEIFFDDDD